MGVLGLPAVIDRMRPEKFGLLTVLVAAHSQPCNLHDLTMPLGFAVRKEGKHSLLVASPTQLGHSET